MKFKRGIAVSVVCLAAVNAFAQSIEQLRAAYSGKCVWDNSIATLRFTGSGDIAFTNAGLKSFIWQIPPGGEAGSHR